jgi:hypothetical protein
MRTALLFLWICFACQAGAADKTPSEAGYWLGVYPPYPGATHVCSQHVSGNTMHINWSLYASKHNPEKVIAFYKNKTGDGDMDQQTAPEFTWRESGERMLHVLPVTARYPDCGVKPPEGTRTVFVVSQATR